MSTPVPAHAVHENFIHHTILGIKFEENGGLIHMPDRSRPLKILHIVGRMNRGGVETWLMNLLRTVSRDSWQMD